MSYKECQERLDWIAAACEGVVDLIGAILGGRDVPNVRTIWGVWGVFAPRIPKGMSAERKAYLMDFFVFVAERVCAGEIWRDDTRIYSSNVMSLSGRLAGAIEQILQEENPDEDCLLRIIQEERDRVAGVGECWQDVAEIVTGLLQTRMEFLDRCKGTATQDPHWDRFCFHPSTDHAVWEVNEPVVLAFADEAFGCETHWDAKRQVICPAAP